MCHGRPTGLQWIEVFWFFFSKKNGFLPYGSGNRLNGIAISAFAVKDRDEAPS
jgi:hypothetical protein